MMDADLEKYKVELEEIANEENHIELFFFMLGARLPKEATHEELMKSFHEGLQMVNIK